MEKQTVNELIRFAEGKMSGKDFDLFQLRHPEIWPWIQSLLTSEMITDPNNAVWTNCHMRTALETNGFRVKATIAAFGFESVSGLSRAHNIISCLLATKFPTIKIQFPASYSTEEFLLSIGLDCIGGEDADLIVEAVLDSIPNELKMSERKRQAKKILKKSFKIEKQKPDWVQEPDWPVNDGTPMRFITQENQGDLFLYHFVDDLTGKEVIIQQLA